jgi:hypothetical protein
MNEQIQRLKDILMGFPVVKIKEGGEVLCSILFFFSKEIIDLKERILDLEDKNPRFGS